MILQINKPELLSYDVHSGQSFETNYRQKEEADLHIGAAITTEIFVLAFESVSDKGQKQLDSATIAILMQRKISTEAFKNLRQRKIVQSTVAKKVIQICFEKIQSKIMQAVEAALVDILQACFGATTNGARTTLYRFIEIFLIQMTCQGALDTFFKPNFDR